MFRLPGNCHLCFVSRVPAPSVKVELPCSAFHAGKHCVNRSCVAQPEAGLVGTIERHDRRARHQSSAGRRARVDPPPSCWKHLRVALKRAPQAACRLARSQNWDITSREITKLGTQPLQNAALNWLRGSIMLYTDRSEPSSFLN